MLDKGKPILETFVISVTGSQEPMQTSWSLPHLKVDKTVTSTKAQNCNQQHFQQFHSEIIAINIVQISKTRSDPSDEIWDDDNFESI